MKNLFIAACFLLTASRLLACTSAIFTGKVTADGRPLLWKNRDTDDENNRIEFFSGKKYDFLALVNSGDKSGAAWTGVNSTGFAIMNTASYNLKDDKSKAQDNEGVLMYKALGECSTLADFERFLDKFPRPMGVEANFGVIDANGGAAYYEVNNVKWTKIDANDPKIAPHGYLVYTNFSYTGRHDAGMGYVRFQTATELIARQAPLHNFTPHKIFSTLSRSFYHSILGTDLLNAAFSPENATGWAIDQDYIPRRITMSAVVIHGVKPSENPEMTTMWTVLGYPPVGIAVPLWVKAGPRQPASVMKSDSTNHAVLCDYALTLKRNVFPIMRGNGNKYLYFNALYNHAGTGYMQQLAPIEAAIAKSFEPYIEKWRISGLNTAELHSLNLSMDTLLHKTYRNLINCSSEP
ncbi:MAG: hypothetical protein LBR06_06650 [Bacteroidales bacterium]|jgi:hypothetical protein|nr:hypothetical protein [Bacteroidales bacterium]